MPASFIVFSRSATLPGRAARSAALGASGARVSRVEFILVIMVFMSSIAFCRDSMVAMEGNPSNLIPVVMDLVHNGVDIRREDSRTATAN